MSVLLGLLVAWVLVRYEFPFQAVVRFAGRSAVRIARRRWPGWCIRALYVENGWLGQFLVPLGIQAAYSRLGHRAGADVYRASVRRPHGAAGVWKAWKAKRKRPPHCSAPARWQTFCAGDLCRRLLPALVTGFALAFARALGEYGSVVFVSGNMPFKTEIAPVLIVARLEEFAYAEATAIAVVLLVGSFTVLVVINLLGAVEQAILCIVPQPSICRDCTGSVRPPATSAPARTCDGRWSRRRSP